MTTFESLLERSVGKWHSKRTYYYPFTDRWVDVTTYFKISGVPEKFSIQWGPDLKLDAGEMNCTYSPILRIMRTSRNYYNEMSVERHIHESSDSVLFVTEVDNVQYHETITFPHDNNIRMRKNVGYNLENNDVFLIGQYLETRVIDD